MAGDMNVHWTKHSRMMSETGTLLDKGSGHSLKGPPGQGDGGNGVITHSFSLFPTGAPGSLCLCCPNCCLLRYGGCPLLIGVQSAQVQVRDQVGTLRGLK